SRYGVVAVAGSKGALHQVVDMVEKPAAAAAPSDLAIFGRYVWAPDVFRFLDQVEPGKGGEVQITDAIRQTIADGQVLALEFSGDYYDTGTIPGYLKANLAFALSRDDLREEMLAAIAELVPKNGGVAAV
ncbi:MAG: sugar phosphate nucleotidyltransferase, partial [Candidatus Dormibacteraceae bacterium]